MPGETDPYERFMRLLMAHEGSLRGYLRSLLPSWDDVDDVTQEASLVAWRKFEDFEEGTNFGGWLMTIGRFQALKHLEKRRRDPLRFSMEMVDLLASEGAEEALLREREHGALRRCLEKLGERQARWMAQVHQPGARVREVAREAGKSAEAFYKIVQRLRRRLEECVRLELERSELR